MAAGRTGAEAPFRDLIRRAWSILGSVALLAVSSPAHAGTATQDPVPQPGDAPSVYLRDCAWCHGPDGEGTNRGPTLQGVGAASADFNLRTGRMPLDSPDEEPRRSDPSYGAGEIEQMVEYIASLDSGPSIPSIAPQSGDLGLGAELFRNHCAACHSVTGTGGAMPQGGIAPTLVGTSPLDVAEAMVLGGEGTFTGSMPVFASDVFDDHEVNSILRYVQYLQQPSHPGGISLGRSGPVGEGIVALGVAVPVLVLFMYWAGSRK